MSAFPAHFFLHPLGTTARGNALAAAARMGRFRGKSRFPGLTSSSYTCTLWSCMCVARIDGATFRSRATKALPARRSFPVRWTGMVTVAPPLGARASPGEEMRGTYAMNRTRLQWKRRGLFAGVPRQLGFNTISFLGFLLFFIVAVSRQL